MAIFEFNAEAPNALGISSFTRVRRSLGADTLTIAMSVDAAAALLWSHGSTITVTKDGAVWFQGTVLRPQRTMNDRAQGIQITVMGAWWRMERKPFTLTNGVGVTIGTVNTGSRHALFINPVTSVPETTKATLNRILDAATAAQYINADVPFSFPDLYAPTEKATDRSLAQVILAVMRYHMDWGSRMTSTHTLSFIKRGQQKLYFDCGAGGAVQDARPIIRQDLVPSGVILRYERQGASQSVGGYRAPIELTEGVYAVDVYPTGTLPSDENVLMETITLRKGEPVPAVGWAETFYRLLADSPLVDGTMVLTDAACDTGIEPAHTINLLGTQAALEWADMNAFVSEVSETPYEGRTEVRFGLPPHLALKDWVDLMRFQNRWRTRDELAASDTPVADPPDTQLTGYVTRRDTDGLWVFRVTSGHVSDGISELVPYWMETSNNLESSPISPNELVLVEGRTVEAWVFVNWRPNPTQFSLLDDDDNSFTQWRDTGRGVIDEARIRFAATDEQAPSVDPASGATTHGHLYFKIGTVTWALGEPAPSFTARRTGNMQILHSPPDRFFLVSPVASDS